MAGSLPAIDADAARPAAALIQDRDRVLALARQTLEIETAALDGLRERLLEPEHSELFLTAVERILNCRGRVIVSGIGKSGHIARKIASTLASTGTPAFFVHPAEASHGDLGMITHDDVLLALSHSGESEELLRILPSVRRQGACIVVMSGNANATLSQNADVHLNSAVESEACPLNLAPTASTTAALALGDALAVTLLDARGFGTEDFARSHPGGALGRKLLTHVRDVMHQGGALPIATPNTPMTEAIITITKGGLGMVAICEPERHVLGILTDGDLRRAFERGVDIQNARTKDLMRTKPHCIPARNLAVDAVAMMEQHRINQLLVLDDEERLIGALNMHDLFRARVI